MRHDKTVLRQRDELPENALPCTATDPDLFHPDPSDPGFMKQLYAAQTVCGPCDRSSTCLKNGVASGSSGVWGGQYLEYGLVVDDPAHRRNLSLRTRQRRKAAA
ncbi:MAG: WhiB family transcriptional regulator [Actinobacteria bacterium]|nr:WhiB family transcriptional regulator [Actinomycetota bacterium]